MKTLKYIIIILSTGNTLANTDSYKLVNFWNPDHKLEAGVEDTLISYIFYKHKWANAMYYSTYPAYPTLTPGSNAATVTLSVFL